METCMYCGCEVKHRRICHNCSDKADLRQPFAEARDRVRELLGLGKLVVSK